MVGRTRKGGRGSGGGGHGGRGGNERVEPRHGEEGVNGMATRDGGGH